MKIRQDVMERIRGRSGDIKPRIIEELGVTRQSVEYWLKYNRENGRLTCKPVLKIIGEVLNLTDDEILTVDPPRVEKETEPCEA